MRDLSIGGDWVKRFTELVDKNFNFADDENLLYINAGTGDHAFALRERLGEKIGIFATCEDEDILRIARDKAAALRSDVDFSMIRFEDDSFDVVLADASFVRPAGLQALIEDSKRVARRSARIAVFFPAVGSFGEIFSLLWEVLFNEDLADHGAAVEKLIADLPTVSDAEELAESAGLVKVKSYSSKEIFEYENGAEFVNSPLVGDFLLPVLLDALSEKEKERVTEKLARVIDSEDGSLSFRFSVKAVLLTAEKK